MLIITGCESADKITLNNLQPPVVPGIFITGPGGIAILGVWRDPYSPSFTLPNSNGGSGGNLIPTKLECSAHPNPDREFVIQFSTTYEARVKVTVVPAIGPGEEPTNSVTYANGTYLAANGVSVRTIIDDFLPPGYFSYYWNGCDDNDMILPDGFYRVYLEFDNEYLVWVDVFLVRNLNNLPPGMDW